MNNKIDLFLSIGLGFALLFGLWSCYNAFSSPKVDKSFEIELHSPEAINTEKQSREIIYNRIKVKEYVETVNSLHSELITLDTSSSKFVEFQIHNKLRFQNNLLSSLGMEEVLIPHYGEEVIRLDSDNKMIFKLEREGDYFKSIPSIFLPMLQIKNYENGG